MSNSIEAIRQMALKLSFVLPESLRVMIEASDLTMAETTQETIAALGYVEGYSGALVRMSTGVERTLAGRLSDGFLYVRCALSDETRSDPQPRGIDIREACEAITASIQRMMEIAYNR